jgi:hypothetical protein
MNNIISSLITADTIMWFFVIIHKFMKNQIIVSTLLCVDTIIWFFINFLFLFGS